MFFLCLFSVKVRVYDKKNVWKGKTMKKISMLFFALALGACAQMSEMTGDNSSQNGMKACLLSEANSRYTAGTLFTSSLKATASEMVKTCAKKMALEYAGVSSEYQSTAENIITNLQNLKNAQ